MYLLVDEMGYESNRGQAVVLVITTEGLPELYDESLGYQFSSLRELCVEDGH